MNSYTRMASHGPHRRPPGLASFAAEQPLAASPVPAAVTGPAAELVGDELRLVVDGRRWRVRGLGRLTSFDVLRVNLMVSRVDGGDGGDPGVPCGHLGLVLGSGRTLFVPSACITLIRRR